MTPPPSLLAALAAALSPARAAVSLARHPDPGHALEAARLAPLPREDRLRALAAALAVHPRPARSSRAAAAGRERGPLAALLRAGEDPGTPPLLVRALLERLWSTD